VALLLSCSPTRLLVRRRRPASRRGGFRVRVRVRARARARARVRANQP